MNGNPLLNFNSLFLTVIIALSGWTIRRVSDIGEKMSAAEERHIVSMRDTTDIRIRLASLEAQAQQNRVEIARLLILTGRP